MARFTDGIDSLVMHVRRLTSTTSRAGASRLVNRTDATTRRIGRSSTTSQRWLAAIDSSRPDHYDPARGAFDKVQEETAMSLRPYHGLLGQTILAMPLVAQVPVPVIDVNEISNITAPMVPQGAPSRNASSMPNELSLVADGRVWFAATSDTYGRELWRYPYTVTQPLRLKDLVTTPLLSSDPSQLTPVKDRSRMFFAAKNIVGAEGLFALDAGDVDQAVALPAGARIEDIAPMGDDGAIVATFTANITTFWGVTGATPTASSLKSSGSYSLVSDLIDCNYDGDGFFAFTSLNPSTTPPTRRLAAYKRSGDVVVHQGDVDNLTRVDAKLYFTATDSDGTSRLFKTDGAVDASTGSAEEVVHATGDSISHLMTDDSSLFFVTAGSSCTVHRYDGDGVPVGLPWPSGWWVKQVGATTLVDDVPHVLGVGNLNSTWYSAIWKVNGTEMQLVKKLEGWGDCSQLVTNDAKLAFVGRYHASNPELRVPHLGFLDIATSTPTPVAIPNLGAGAMPTSLIALPDRVVFVAHHRLQGIEPWYCDFPGAPDTN